MFNNSVPHFVPQPDELFILILAEIRSSNMDLKLLRSRNALAQRQLCGPFPQPLRRSHHERVNEHS